MGKVDFEKYLHLYETGVSIKRVNPINDQTYRVLVTSNVDIRIIDRDSHIAEIALLPNLANFSKDTTEYSGRFFYAIPVQTVKGTIVGFIFRSVFGKNYTTVNKDASDKLYKVPFMFGFYKDFEDYDSYNYCKPIIICEGLKDCIVLKKIYPYVLANNTSSMGINFHILSNITDKFILIYDNDSAGQEGMNTDTVNILKRRGDVIIIRPKVCYKDSADCYDNEEDFREFSEEVKVKIKQLENNNSLAIGRQYIVRR